MHSNLLLCHGHQRVPVHLFHDMMGMNTCKHFNICLLKLMWNINIWIKNINDKLAVHENEYYVHIYWYSYKINRKLSGKCALFNYFWSPCIKVLFVKLFHMHMVVFECLAFIFVIFCSPSCLSYLKTQTQLSLWNVRTYIFYFKACVPEWAVYNTCPGSHIQDLAE